MKLDDYMALARLALPNTTVIPANDNGPRATKPYATASLTPLRAFGIHHGKVGDDGKRNNSAHRRATFTLSIYGVGCEELAETYLMMLGTDAIITKANYTYDIAFGIPDTVLNVPNLMDGVTFEPRSVVSIETFYTRQQKEDVGYIAEVSGQVKLEGPVKVVAGDWTDFDFSVQVAP